MNRHPKKLQLKAAKCKVVPSKADTFKVTSPSTETYLVHTPTKACTCKWQTYNPNKTCAHVVAANALKFNGRASVWDSEQDAKRQHKKLVKLVDGLYLTIRR